MLRGVATCCEVLGVVGSILKMVKVCMLHLRMLHDASLAVWPGLCMLRPTGLRYVAFDSWGRLAGAL